jgi:anti-sigma B factor antagonist
VDLQIDRSVDEGVPMVAVRGELDLAGAPDLRRALAEAIDGNPGRRVVVDLEGVEFIDSAGLGVLAGGLQRARAGEGDLVLVATGQTVVRALELTGLTRVFRIHPSRAAALSTGSD